MGGAKMIRTLISLFLLLPSLAFAGQGMGPGPGCKTYSAGSSCDTVEQSGGIDTADMILSTTYLQVSHSFTASSSYGLCSARFSLWKTGTPTETITVELWSDNAGAPSAKISDVGTISASTITTSPALYSFTGISAPLTSATRYHYVFIATMSGTNTIRIDRNSSGAERNYRYTSSWALDDSSSALVFDNYK